MKLTTKEEGSIESPTIDELSVIMAEPIQNTQLEHLQPHHLLQAPSKQTHVLAV
jgi:hypothetical protein